MAELDELRQKRLENLSRQKAEEQQEAETEAKLNQLVNRILEPEARTRLNNVKFVNKERYLMAVQYLLALAQSGRLEGKLDEEGLKALLTTLAAGKKGITIKRK